jgi:PAS domain-containing protein
VVDYSREDLASGCLNWKNLTSPEWRDQTERAVMQLKATGILQPYEKEYFRKDGSRVPVLVGSAVFEEGQNEAVTFVLDLSEQKRAEEALRRSQARLAETQAELAHITRVTSLGELTASIAHEIGQPLAAVVTNADASLRWLSGDSPDMLFARDPLVGQFIAEATRAQAHAGDAVDGVYGQGEAVGLVADGQLKRRVDVAVLLVAAHVDVVLARPPVGESVQYSHCG